MFQRFITSRRLTIFVTLALLGLSGQTYAKNAYDTLGVPQTATDEELRSAFRRLSKQFHPDLNKEPGASDKLREVIDAYRLIESPELRAAYDRSLSRPNPNTRVKKPAEPSVLSRFLNERLKSVRLAADNDPVLTLFLMFYDAKGKALRTQDFIMLATGEWTTPNPEQKTEVRDLFRQLASKIDYLKDRASRLDQFENNVFSQPLDVALVRYMVSVQEHGRAQRRIVRFNAPPADDEKFADRRMIGHLIRAVSEVCVENLTECLDNMALSLSELKAESLSLLDEVNAAELTALIDRATEEQPKSWLFSEAYWRLNNLRGRLVGLNSGTLARAASCARILTQHATRKFTGRR